MSIVEIRHKWPKDLFLIDLHIGNICNYKCWYCFKGSNEGNHKWPKYEIITENMSHLIDYYNVNNGKKKIDFHVLGGEATHWPKFIDFIKYMKDKYDCIFSLTSNGSKNMQWWEKAIPYLDYVTISSHHEFSNKEHLRDLCDFIYDKNVIVVMVVLMDPTNWDKCMEMVEYYKKSKRRWTIRYQEVLADGLTYTPEQKKILNVFRVRKNNPFWFWKNNKSYTSSVSVVDENGKVKKVEDHYLLLEKFNRFSGWECTVGVDWLAVKADGAVEGICGNNLFNEDKRYNLFDLDFKEQFQPTIKPTICRIEECRCQFEVNATKRKLI